MGRNCIGGNWKINKSKSGIYEWNWNGIGGAKISARKSKPFTSGWWVN